MEKRITVMEFLLKLINSIFTLFGLAIGSHGLFCLMKWKQDWSYYHNKYEIALTKALLGIDASKSWLSTNLPVAWFVYLLLVVGASLIVISCFGYVGAATRNSCCLCFVSSS
ncbi:tobamovirus multiplication protein 2A-like [Hevea brasiliensis]|uniref:tobamovirus multiplication protein 2A-like n=1 Tax=Hevea brasiliensis TaxID=3981 RepID=UPI0025E072BF|nr:tobamovirus multiplication protein 2A-like [Hevea brasiliensis]